MSTAAVLSSSQPYILYTATICPYAQRTELAFAEAGKTYERVEIDLGRPRDEWYLKSVNSVGKVPTLAVNANDDSKKAFIPESLVIANYIAEEFPESKLLPTDAFGKARVRLVIERAQQLISANYPSAFLKGEVEGFQSLYDNLKQLNDFILEISPEGPFVFGDKLTLADVAIAPFIARILVSVHPDQGLLPTGAPDIYGKYHTELARLKQIQDAITARPSWQKSWNEAVVIDLIRRRFKKPDAKV